MPCVYGVPQESYTCPEGKDGPNSWIIQVYEVPHLRSTRAEKQKSLVQQLWLNLVYLGLEDARVVSHHEKEQRVLQWKKGYRLAPC